MGLEGRGQVRARSQGNLVLVFLPPPPQLRWHCHLGSHFRIAGIWYFFPQRECCPWETWQRWQRGQESVLLGNYLIDSEASEEHLGASASPCAPLLEATPLPCGQRPAPFVGQTAPADASERLVSHFYLIALYSFYWQILFKLKWVAGGNSYIISFYLVTSYTMGSAWFLFI